MGAWGHHFDENDAALDWIGDFENDPSWERVGGMFEAVFAEEDVYDVDSDDCANAIAAGEIVAAALGRPNVRLGETLLEWAKAHAAGAVALKADAKKAATLVKDESELSELWEEGEEASDWVATIDDLISRLS